MELQYEQLDQELLKSIPELGPLYDKEMEWWKDEKPGAHIIFGDLLNPFLHWLLEEGVNQALIRRIFIFLEKMANSSDVRVQEVVAVTVLEALMDKKIILEKAKEYMGQSTMRVLTDLEKFWDKK